MCTSVFFYVFMGVFQIVYVCVCLCVPVCVWCVCVCVCVCMVGLNGKGGFNPCIRIGVGSDYGNQGER